MLSTVQSLFNKSWYYFSSSPSAFGEQAQSNNFNLQKENNWFSGFFRSAPPVKNLKELNPNSDWSLSRIWQQYFVTSKLVEAPPVIPSFTERIINYISPKKIEEPVEEPSMTSDQMNFSTIVSAAALLTLFLTSVITVYYSRSRNLIRNQALFRLKNESAAVESNASINHFHDEAEDAQALEFVEDHFAAEHDRDSLLSEQGFNLSIISMTPEEEPIIDVISNSLKHSLSSEDVPTVLTNYTNELPSRSNSLEQ